MEEKASRQGKGKSMSKGIKVRIIKVSQPMCIAGFVFPSHR
jgi:hypothetical protein